MSDTQRGMKCPSCGNYAKSEFNLFFGMAMLKFKCQFCNEVLRGNALMIFLDLLSYLLFVIYAMILSAFAPQLAALFDDITFPLLGIIGALGIRLPMSWLMSKTGGFNSAA
jgi:hypothetical protein